MKKMIFALLPLILLLTACRGIEVDVPDNQEAKATQALVEKYIEASLSYDADGLMSLYAEYLFWMDYGGNDGPITKGNLDFFVHETMAARDFKYDFKSYLITPDGRFAAIRTLYSQAAASTGKMESVECVCLLEFKDGKIVSETWYYDGSVFH